MALSIDESIMRILGKPSISRTFIAKKQPVMGITPKASSQPISKKTKDLFQVAKGSIFFPFTQPTVKNPYSGRVIKGHNPTTKNVMKNIFGDIDNDKVLNFMDCGPNRQGPLHNTTVQSLFYTGDVLPSRKIARDGYLYAFSSLDFARGWKRKKGYRYIYKIIADNFILDKKQYVRMTNGKIC